MSRWSLTQGGIGQWGGTVEASHLEQSTALSLLGEQALVTGAGSNGIGRAIALGFARAGADVAIHWHTKHDRATELVDNIRAQGRRSTALQADLADAASCRELVSAAERSLGGLSILVTAAGAHLRKQVLETSDAEWDALMALNLRGPFTCAREAARLIKASGRRGRIILIGSVVQAKMIAGQVAYATSKAALSHLARGMALELAPIGITINVIAPGPTLSDMTRTYFADADNRARREATIPAGRIADPDDFVAAALFLASPAAGYVTGASLIADGGFSLS